MKRIGSIILSMLCFFVMTGCQTVQQYPRTANRIRSGNDDNHDDSRSILSAGNRFRTCQHGNAGRSTGTGGGLQIIHAVHRGK